MRALDEIGIELNNICNFRCTHCLRDFSQDARSLPFDLIERVLGEAQRYRVSHLAFTGGEPTLHPDLARILQAADRLGYTYHVVTNGSTLPRLWGRVFEGLTGLTGISLSLDGAREETHDAIRGDGSFRQVMGAISLCHAKGVPITVQMIVNTRNRAELGEFALLVGQLGVRKAFYGFMLPVPQAVALDLVPSPEEMLAVKAELERLKRLMSWPIELSVGHFEENPLAICRTLDMSTMYIDHRGNLNFCCQLSGYLEADDRESEVIASLHTHSLQEAHLLLVDRIARHHRDKIARIGEESLSLADQFPCFYCAKYFDKVGWLERTASPWGGGSSAHAPLELTVL